MSFQVTDQQVHTHSRYVWGDKQVNKITSLSFSWGDSPIYHISIENDTVYFYRRINGSRDGWMKFRNGYFDKKEKLLDMGRKEKLVKFLETIDFTKWVTNERTIWNIENGACGFCVKELFKCGFDDGNTFYCANPPKESFLLMVDYFKEIFAEEIEDAFGSKVNHLWRKKYID